MIGVDRPLGPLSFEKHAYGTSAVPGGHMASDPGDLSPAGRHGRRAGRPAAPAARPIPRARPARTGDPPPHQRRRCPMLARFALSLLVALAPPAARPPDVLLVASNAEHSLALLDAATGRELARLPTGEGPHE